MRISRRLGCFAALATLAVVAGPVSPASAATTRWVNDDDPNGGAYVAPGTSCADPGYATIGAAVGAAVSGDTIKVCAGTYAESSIGIPTGLSLQGPNYGISPNGGTRVAEATVTGAGPVIRISTTQPVTIDGFTFSGGSGAPIDSYTTDNRPTIAHNIFTAEDDGLFFANSASVTFADNYLHDLTDCGSCDGLFLAGNWDGTTGTTASISNNVWERVGSSGMNLSNVSGTISGNRFSKVTYYGALLANGTNVDVSGNTFDQTINPDLTVRTWGAGVRFYTPGPGFGARITGNTFTSNYVGIGVRMGSPTADITGRDVYAHQNNFVGNTAAGIRHDGLGTFNAECNWWNSSGGPAAPGADKAEGPVDYTPWLTASAPGGSCDGPLTMDQKRGIRNDLATYRATVTDKQDGKRLDEAIKFIDKSLDPALWNGPTHLDPKKGQKVFEEEKHAVEKLQEIQKDRKSTSRAAMQSFIDRIVAVDRRLAQTAVTEAAGGNPKEVAKANDELTKGDQDAAAGKPTDAIDHYRSAWEHAQKARAGACDGRQGRRVGGALLFSRTLRSGNESDACQTDGYDGEHH
jgi:hypothetical protein